MGVFFTKFTNIWQKLFIFDIGHIIYCIIGVKMNFKQTALMRPTDNIAENETMRGVAKFEDTGKKCLYISIINLKTPQNGRLELHYATNAGDYKFNLPNPSGGTIELPQDALYGGGVLLAHVTDDTATPLLYGAFSKGAPTKEDILAPVVYDDEALATENYYEFEKISDNQHIDEDNENEGQNVGTENYVPHEKNFSEKQEESKEFGADEDENELRNEKTYYGKIQSELEKIFKDHPSESDLENVVPMSKWAKISYEGNKYYAVGIIYENDEPEYICYGLPGKYGERPKEIKSYCSFIPSSVFKLKGNGYWVIFQRAKDGASIVDFFKQKCYTL